MEKIYNFIEYKNPEINLPLVIAHFFIFSTSFFIVWLFLRDKKWIMILLMSLIVLYSLVVVFYIKNKSEKKSFLITGGYSVIISLYIMFAIAGFFKNSITIVLFEVFVFLLFQFVVFLICYINIKNDNFNPQKTLKINKLVWVAGSTGYIFGGVIFSNISQQEYWWVAGVFITVALIYSAGSSYLLRFYLYETLKNKKQSKLIESLTKQSGDSSVIEP